MSLGLQLLVTMDVDMKNKDEIDDKVLSGRGETNGNGRDGDKDSTRDRDRDRERDSKRERSRSRERRERDRRDTGACSAFRIQVNALDYQHNGRYYVSFYIAIRLEAMVVNVILVQFPSELLCISLIIFCCWLPHILLEVYDQYMNYT